MPPMTWAADRLTCRRGAASALSPAPSVEPLGVCNCSPYVWRGRLRENLAVWRLLDVTVLAAGHVAVRSRLLDALRACCDSWARRG